MAIKRPSYKLKVGTYKLPIDLIQEESSDRFTLSFHAYCAQMQRFNQNLNLTSHTGSELGRFLQKVQKVHPAFFFHS